MTAAQARTVIIPASIRERPEPRQSGPNLGPNSNHGSARAPSARRRREMESGNEVREWLSSWWGRKVLLLAWRDDFRAPGWAPRDQTCARRVARRRNGFRAAREGWGGSLPALAPFRSRCRQGCPQERTCPRSPRDFRPQAGKPECPPARIKGREDGLTPIAFPKFGNHSLTPSPIPPVPIKWVSARGVAGSPREVFGHGPGCPVAGVLGTGLPPDVRR